MGFVEGFQGTSSCRLFRQHPRFAVPMTGILNGFAPDSAWMTADVSPTFSVGDVGYRLRRLLRRWFHSAGLDVRCRLNVG